MWFMPTGVGFLQYPNKPRTWDLFATCMYDAPSEPSANDDTIRKAVEPTSKLPSWYRRYPMPKIQDAINPATDQYWTAGQDARLFNYTYETATRLLMFEATSLGHGPS